MRFRVHVSLKNGVHDPQGEAALRVLKLSGLDGFKDVRIGKVLDVEVDARTHEEAKALVEKASKDLFCNTVIERFTVTELAADA
jgi:phosphoribosylformylglycinamidine synthase